MVDIKFENFFDRSPVLRAIDAATKTVLSKAGSFVRRTAKSSIRKRKKSAPPGTPPSSHVGTLKNLISFQYDPESKSVVIGPKLYRKSGLVGRGKNRRIYATGSKTGPELLEFGGIVSVDEVNTAMIKDRYVVMTPHDKMVYKGNPFMRTALEKESSNFPQLFTNSVK
jgi:hypothetical protein